MGNRGKGMYKLPAMYVGQYAEKDAAITLELWQILKREIDNQDINLSSNRD